MVDDVVGAGRSTVLLGALAAGLGAVLVGALPGVFVAAGLEVALPANAVGVLAAGVLAAEDGVAGAGVSAFVETEGDAATEGTDADSELPAPVAVAATALALSAAVPPSCGPHALSVAAITLTAMATISLCL